VPILRTYADAVSPFPHLHCYIQL